MINIILCTDKIDLVADFYQAVGIVLEFEKHGNGPEHFSFKSDLSCEIYPPRVPAEERIVLRIDTADIDQAMANLTQKFTYPGLVISDIKSLSTGRKSIVKDPDGRVVELFQAFEM